MAEADQSSLLEAVERLYNNRTSNKINDFERSIEERNLSKELDIPLGVLRNLVDAYEGQKIVDNSEGLRRQVAWLDYWIRKNTIWVNPKRFLQIIGAVASIITFGWPIYETLEQNKVNAQERNQREQERNQREQERNQQEAERIELEIKQEIQRSWNILTDSRLRDLGASGGRIEALEFLNAQGVNLHGVDLKNAYLVGIELKRAKMTGANLTNVNLDKAKLQEIELVTATLVSTGFRDADLSGATFVGSDLTSAKLRRAKLTGSKLQSVVLIGADLTGADLSGVDLTNADLSGANLTGANLSNAILSCTNFTGTTIAKTEFKEADLFYADFTGVQGLNSNSLISASNTSSILDENNPPSDASKAACPYRP